MIFYQIILFTLSTVSIIHCSQQPSQNEDSNAAYHIEFEDKSVHGGYGYKLQVAGKEKYQESWKKDQPITPTVTPTASGTLDYSQNNYAASVDVFTPEVQSFSKPKENNFPQDNYLSNSGEITNSDDSFASEKQYSSVASFTPSSENTFENKQISQTSSVSNDQSYPTYSTINNFNSHTQHVNKPESSISSQNSFSSHNYETTSQDWQVPSKPRFIPSGHYPIKPSVQIMGTNYIEGPTHTGPQVYVESISGKLNHNPYSNQYDSTPQINFAVSHGSSNNYFQNSKNVLQHLVKNPANSHTDISTEYYQLNYKPTTPKSQYVSRLPSHSSQSNNIEEIKSNENIHYSPLKYSTQYTSPVSSQSVNQYGTSQQIHYYKDNISQKPVGSQISSIPSTQFIQDQKVKHSKGNTFHKSLSSSIKYAPQHQIVQYIPMQDSNQGYGNILHKPSVSVNQYTSQLSSIPSQQFASAQGAVSSHDNILYTPSVLSSNYATEAPSVPLTHFANQEITKYVLHQPTSSVQFKPSIQLQTDYSQLLQQYHAQYPQESVAPLQSYTKEIPQQNLYSVGHQPVNKNVVSYHYKQEFPATSSSNQMYVSPNLLNSPQVQPISLNSYSSKDLSNTYNNLLSGYNTQSMLGNVANGIPVHSFEAYANVENNKENTPLLYAPGLTYGYDSHVGKEQGLLNTNGLNNIANNAYLGGLQFRRRSSGSTDRKHDQKQTE